MRSRSEENLLESRSAGSIALCNQNPRGYDDRGISCSPASLKQSISIRSSNDSSAGSGRLNLSSRIPVPMKSFKITSLNTDVEGSPPPPPAPADPSVEAANAAVAAAAAAAAAEGSAHQYGDLYPTYNTYLMNRYSDQRYHTPPSYTTTSGYSTGSHISAHASETGYY